MPPRVPSVATKLDGGSTATVEISPAASTARTAFAPASAT